jgi:hypothetical protein
MTRHSVIHIQKRRLPQRIPRKPGLNRPMPLKNPTQPPRLALEILDHDEPVPLHDSLSNRSYTITPPAAFLPPLAHEIPSRIFQALIGVGMLEFGIGLYRIVRDL